jgi:hypothetical protein
MKLVEVIKKQTDGSVESVVKFLLEKGMISYTTITHAEIFQTYDSLLSSYTIKKEPKAKRLAIIDTANEHKIEPRSVYKVIAEYKDLV